MLRGRRHRLRDIATLCSTVTDEHATATVSELVTVFESTDMALLAMAKAALEGAGVRYVTQNELTQDLFGLGRMGGGYNLITGPIRIRVVSENAERARDLLAELHD